jgi:threonine/homoserine/homoserine lactone efflux protein
MRLGRLALTAFLTGFSGAAMPGPVLAATIWYAAGPLGFAAGPLIVLGHFVVELTLVLALAAGLARRLARPEAPLLRAVGLVGGLMLLLMAWDMLRHLPGLSLAGVASSPQTLGPVPAGMLLSLSNPYFWLWWATIGLGLFGRAVAEGGRAGLAAFYSGHILSDLAWYSLVAGLLATTRHLLSDGLYRGLIGACALLLVVCGLRFVALSARRPRVAPA